MNCLVLFSGTKSFSKTMLRMNKESNRTIYKEIRTLDLDNHFKPTYNVNILEWDYKTDLKDFKVDFLHSSPVCTHFSKLKNHSNDKRDLKLGYSLFNKTIEIIEWIKKNNNKYIKFTIENPKSKLTLEYEPLMKYKRIITSYCSYSFLYQKDTTFFYGGFDLKLKERCNKKNICFSKSINNNKCHKVRIGVSKNSKTHKLGEGQIGDNKYYKYLREIIKDNPNSNTNIHKVLMGYRSKNPVQMIDWKYFTYLRKNDDYKGVVMSDTFFRYRIPPLLIEDILKSLDNCLEDCKCDYCYDDEEEIIIEEI